LTVGAAFILAQNKYKIKGRSNSLNNTMIMAALGTVAGVLTGVILGKHLTGRKMRRWCERMERKQIDTEIRLDLLEYNHLHEDGNLRMVFFVF
jgi:membrane protein YqaA with SNARE-associated domain